MYEKEKQDIIDAAREMERRGLVVMSGGNVSLRLPDGSFLVTPSAMDYGPMLPSDIVRLDRDGRVLEGLRRPSSDHLALLYLFNHRPEIDAIIHTHQPLATALGLVCERLPANQTTVIDELGGDVPVAPFARSSDEGMGIAADRVYNGSRAVLLRHHGALAFGKTPADALSAAVFLEQGCMVYLAALSTGRPVPLLTPEQIAGESEIRGNYGQP